jgi:ferrochelatase
MPPASHWGFLFVNLGTPDAPEVAPVRRYLRQFLSDPRVFDMTAWKRWLILELFILPFRPKQSAHAYRKIWTSRGSPLLFHGHDLIERVRAALGNDGQRMRIELAMRYQSPSIRSALEKLRADGVDRIVLFPMFPQYSSAAWGSAVESVFEEASRLWDVPAIFTVPPFYDHPAFLEAFASVARPVIDEIRADKVLFSFHGLPERHCTKSDASGGRHCLQSADCCDAIVFANRNCYRAQCFATARGIASALRLPPERWEIAFQSRLGRDPWIQPFTDVRVKALPKERARRVAILSPAFVADCLETLEELAMRARDDFLASGGEELRLVPSLNASEPWVRAVVRMLRETAPAAFGDAGHANQSEEGPIERIGSTPRA